MLSACAWVDSGRTRLPHHHAASSRPVMTLRGKTPCRLHTFTHPPGLHTFTPPSAHLYPPSAHLYPPPPVCTPLPPPPPAPTHSASVSPPVGPSACRCGPEGEPSLSPSCLLPVWPRARPPVSGHRPFLLKLVPWLSHCWVPPLWLLSFLCAGFEPFLTPRPGSGRPTTADGHQALCTKPDRVCRHTRVEGRDSGP